RFGVEPAVERQRSGVGGGVVLEMVTERRGSVAAWVVLAVGRRTLPEKWRRVTESEVGDRVDWLMGVLFGFAGKSPPKKFFGGGRSAVAAGGEGWPE
nr:hypothetical protein [Tanacetum cinerariifolium]